MFSALAKIRPSKQATSLAVLDRTAAKLQEVIEEAQIEKAPTTARPEDKKHREALVAEAGRRHFQDQPFGTAAMVGGGVGVGMPLLLAAIANPSLYARDPGRLLQMAAAGGVVGTGAGLGVEAIGRLLTRNFGPQFRTSQWHRDQDPNRWNTALRAAPMAMAALAGRTLPTMYNSIKGASNDQELRKRIAEACRQTTLPNLKEIEHGQYQKGHFSWKGLRITIESAPGAVRRGVDKDGTEWSVTLKNAYGYIRGTTSAEPGDQMDIFMGPHPESEIVFVVDQNKQKSKVFDEHKVVAGVRTAQEAKDLYLANYSKSWTGFRAVTALTLDQFKSWLKRGDMTKPLAGQQFKDFHKQAGLLDELKRQLPQLHVPETTAGAVAGAGTGLAVQLLRRILQSSKDRRRKQPSLLKGMLVGGGLGAFGANLVGDRARRYFSNLPDPFDYDFDKKWNKIKELGWGGVYQGAIQDQPIKYPGSKYSPEAATMRWEMLRRGLNVPTNGAAKDYFKQVGQDATGSPMLEMADRFFDSTGRANESGRAAWEQLLPYNLVDSLRAPKNDSVLTKGQLLKGFTLRRLGTTLGLRDKWNFDLHPKEGDQFMDLLATRLTGGFAKRAPLDAEEDMNVLKSLGSRWLLDHTIASGMPTFNQSFAFPNAVPPDLEDPFKAWDKGVVPHRIP
jgi:hypothetical protein